MKPQHFNESNTEIAKGQEEYQTLPAFSIDEPEGRTLTCWKLTVRERLWLLLTGKLWHQQLTFKEPMQPIHMSVKKSDYIVHPAKLLVVGKLVFGYVPAQAGVRHGDRSPIHRFGTEYNATCYPLKFWREHTKDQDIVMLIGWEAELQQ